MNIFRFIFFFFFPEGYKKYQDSTGNIMKVYQSMKGIGKMNRG